jgi:branched-chain amino acid transport system ATP-binding protein
MGSVLEVRDLYVGYGDVEILHGINLTVPEGGLVALVGPNSAGKTTLIRTISGLLKPWSGEVVFDGEPMGRWTAHRRSRNGLCTVMGGQGVFRGLTVRENLAMCFHGRHSKAALEQIESVFPILVQRLNQTAGLLSGGEQQILALARAFLTEPKLVVADELSLGLAPLIVQEIFNALDRIRAAGRAVLVVEQYVNRVLDLADEAAVLTGGEITFRGTADELKQGDVFEHYLAATKG